MYESLDLVMILSTVEMPRIFYEATAWACTRDTKKDTDVPQQRHGFREIRRTRREGHCDKEEENSRFHHPDELELRKLTDSEMLRRWKFSYLRSYRCYLKRVCLES